MRRYGFFYQANPAARAAVDDALSRRPRNRNRSYVIGDGSTADGSERLLCKIGAYWSARGRCFVGAASIVAYTKDGSAIHGIKSNTSKGGWPPRVKP